ncbi:heavy-metal-associated domain-containing protein [Flaviaesturariibacter aridisoli]|uniref:Copper chaperone n=1 Tax=Flaviaesturariibacter aridisoli TaxID=2545761 RepID=A0A4R4DTH3_9BACT|nr:heavy-metal-associated domain-containing protein [Flaviaesturariibacter aridisoli]RYY67243.1 MAG: copper chaperone [Chitinophagaceae bacterium]TCZ65288.1 copper chaperone [Flaviaesturariibacter aridisoli]
MKKILFLLLLAVGISQASFAQSKAIQTIKISLPTVQECDVCKEKIETYLKRYDGVASVAVNLRRKEATIKYFTDRITDEDIKAAIATAGFDANEVKAEPDAYNRLPKCCKIPETKGAAKAAQ